MVARFIYRVVSIIFQLMAGLCWLLTASALAAQFHAAGFNFRAFCVGIVAPTIAFMAHQCGIEAWRAARIHHVRYD